MCCEWKNLLDYKDFGRLQSSDFPLYLKKLNIECKTMFIINSYWKQVKFQFYRKSEAYFEKINP